MGNLDRAADNWLNACRRYGGYQKKPNYGGSNIRVVVKPKANDNDDCNGNNNANNAIKTKSLKDFISKHKEAIISSLSKVMNVSFKGLAMPELYKAACDRMALHCRRPKLRQARLIAAAYEHLQKNRSLLINAEMSTGKTQMAVSLLDLLNAKRVGIMSPSHLVSKWAREIQEILGEGSKAIRPYKIIIVNCGGWASLDLYRGMKVKKGESLIFIFSYSAAKLGYKSRKVAVKKRTIRLIDQVNQDGIKVPKKTICHALVCPDCGNDIVEADPNASVIEASYDLIPRKCPKCGSILRQPKQGEKRLSLAEYAQRKLPRGWFDLLIVDEIHEVKGGDTGQGNAFGTLVARSKKVVGLTGTLLNGYAESVFYVLYRLSPSLMKNQLGLEYKEVERFIDLYGARERRWSAKETTFDAVEGVIVKKRGTPMVKSLPRINPLLLTQLLGTSIFLNLDEMNVKMPKYSEIVERVTPDEAVKNAYSAYIESLIKLIKERSSEGMRKLGELATASLAILGVPDKPRGDEIAAYIPEVARTKAEAEANGRKYVLPITNKEQRLVEIVRDELANNRKCAIFVTFSQLGTVEAIENVLKQAIPHKIIRTLPDTVKAERREAWIEKNKADVLITNPEKVKTGLDLLDYPTLIFFQPTYKVYTLRQASRRSWRLNQRQEVKIYFLVYEHTPEEKALQLIAKKLSTSSVIEGKIGGGLADEASDESIAVALAKSIIAKERVDDFQMDEIVLGLRDNDPFEAYYLNLCAKADEANAIDKAQEVNSNSLASLFETPLTYAVEALKEQAVKEEKANATNVSTDDAANAIDADRKITIYRVVMKDKRKVEQRLELAKSQLDELIANEETKATFQMAFDF